MRFGFVSRCHLLHRGRPRLGTGESPAGVVLRRDRRPGRERRSRRHGQEGESHPWDSMRRTSNSSSTANRCRSTTSPRSTTVAQEPHRTTALPRRPPWYGGRDRRHELPHLHRRSVRHSPKQGSDPATRRKRPGPAWDRRTALQLVAFDGRNLTRHHGLDELPRRDRRVPCEQARDRTALGLLNKFGLGFQTRRSVMAAAGTVRSFADAPGRKVMLLLSAGWDTQVDLWNPRVLWVLGLSEARLPDLYGPLVHAANLVGYSLYPIDMGGGGPARPNVRRESTIWEFRPDRLRRASWGERPAEPEDPERWRDVLTLPGRRDRRTAHDQLPGQPGARRDFGGYALLLLARLRAPARRGRRAPRHRSGGRSAGRGCRFARAGTTWTCRGARR